MVAFKYAVITTGLSACAGVVASVVHKRPNPKGYDLRPSSSVIAEMPKTTRFDPPPPTSLAPANNNLQRPLARGIYWSAGTTPGSRLSPRAFVMPRHANLVASATALAASGLSLVIDLVNSVVFFAFELGSSALSSASTWALSSSSSMCPAAKPAVPSSNELAVPASALESPADASATTLLETTVAYAMSIMASTAAYARVAALASATSQVDAARSTAVALHLSALSSANAILVSALASASSLRSTALATASATTLDEATLSLHSAAALLNSALSAAAVLVPSAAATATSATFVFEKAPLLEHAHARVASIEGAAHTSLLTSAVASVNHFVGPVLADVSAAIGWMRRRERATPVIAPTPTRAAIASNPVPT